MTTLEKMNTGRTSSSVKKVSPTAEGDSTPLRQEFAAKGKEAPSGGAAQVFLDEKKKELEQATKNVSDYVQNITRELNFTVDEELGRFVVSVVDQETGEVIRQIPTDEVLKLAKTLHSTQEKSITGILFQGDA